MARVVICDDDSVVRASIATLCEDAGLEVVAETDNGGDAAEMVRRFGVDLLVLDLSLGDGTGEHTLDLLGTEGTTNTAVVVFTAFAYDAARLLRKGAREVVEKPDFVLLGDILAQVGSSIDAATRTEDRRIASRDITTAAPAWRSPSGVSSRDDLGHALSELEAGDAILAVTVAGLEVLEVRVGRLLTADCLLAVAAALRSVLRVQDLLHEAPEVSGFIALLRGGDARAAEAVWSRLRETLGDWSYGEVRAAAGRVDSLGPSDAVARVTGALQSATPAGPSYLPV